MKPLTIVSADTHVGLPPEEYSPYLDAKYRDNFQWFLEDNQGLYALFRKVGFPYGAEVLDIIDDRGAISGGGYVGFFDAKRRLRAAEADGVVAEILHPAGPISVPPFCDSTSRLVSHELRAAGSMAHNRFLAEFCDEDPKRLLGVALTYPWPDMDAAVKTVHWAAEHHMVAVYPARFAGVDLPAFYDSSWDPFWAACCETGIVVHIHAGHGRPQGSTAKAAQGTAKIEGKNNTIGRDNTIGGLFDDIFEERRGLVQLIWGGVFDRFPDLKVAFVEIRADWIPQTLAFLDRRYAENPKPLPRLTPSEYWHRNCAVTASFMRASDLAARREIGIERFMFATDYPHAESTWPNTLDYLRVVIDGESEDDMRAILGETAMNFYGLDKPLLEGVAARIGVLPSDLLNKSSSVDPRLVDHFAQRNGLRKGTQYDENRLAIAVRKDLEGAAAAQGLSSSSVAEG